MYLFAISFSRGVANSFASTFGYSIVVRSCERQTASFRMANMGHVVRLSTYIADCMRAASSNGKAGAGEETAGAGSKPQMVAEDAATAERMRCTGEMILSALNAWPEWSAPAKSSASAEPNEVFAGDETKPAADAGAGAESTATPASAPAEQQQTPRDRWRAFIEGPIEEMRNKNKITLRVRHLKTHSCSTLQTSELG